MTDRILGLGTTDRGARAPGSQGGQRGRAGQGLKQKNDGSGSPTQMRQSHTNASGPRPKQDAAVPRKEQGKMKKEAPPQKTRKEQSKSIENGYLANPDSNLCLESC